MNGAIDAVTRQRQLARASQKLEGIICGIVADGQLNDMELLMLRTWLAENDAITQVWPGSTIARHLDEVFADGAVTDDERASLLALLASTAGSDFSETGATAPAVAEIPYDESCAVDLRDAGICLTGAFLYGTREACTRVSEKAGAVTYSNPSRKTRYLVVGTHVSPDWLCQSYGRKIQAAMELKSKGVPLAILSERRWFEALSTHL